MSYSPTGMGPHTMLSDAPPSAMNGMPPMTVSTVQSSGNGLFLWQGWVTPLKNDRSAIRSVKAKSAPRILKFLEHAAFCFKEERSLQPSEDYLVEFARVRDVSDSVTARCIETVDNNDKCRYFVVHDQAAFTDLVERVNSFSVTAKFLSGGGWLWKRSSSMRENWLRRWFARRGDNLLYWRKRPSNFRVEPAGIISLRFAEVQVEHDHERNAVFTVTSSRRAGGRHLELQADSMQAAQRWVDELQCEADPFGLDPKQEVPSDVIQATAIRSAAGQRIFATNTRKVDEARETLRVGQPSPTGDMLTDDEELVLQSPIGLDHSTWRGTHFSQAFAGSRMASFSASPSMAANSRLNGSRFGRVEHDSEEEEGAEEIMNSRRPLRRSELGRNGKAKGRASQKRTNNRRSKLEDDSDEMDEQDVRKGEDDIRSGEEDDMYGLKRRTKPARASLFENSEGKRSKSQRTSKRMSSEISSEEEDSDGDAGPQLAAPVPRKNKSAVSSPDIRQTEEEEQEDERNRAEEEERRRARHKEKKEKKHRKKKKDRDSSRGKKTPRSSGRKSTSMSETETPPPPPMDDMSDGSYGPPPPPDDEYSGNDTPPPPTDDGYPDDYYGAPPSASVPYAAATGERPNRMSASMMPRSGQHAAVDEDAIAAQLDALMGFDDDDEEEPMDSPPSYHFSPGSGNQLDTGKRSSVGSNAGKRSSVSSVATDWDSLTPFQKSLRQGKKTLKPKPRLSPTDGW